jgi:hypothetical protein
VAGSEKSRDRARGWFFFALSIAALIFLHSLMLRSGSLLDAFFEVHPSGTSFFVMTPALRMALSLLDSAAAGPAKTASSASDAARRGARKSCPAQDHPGTLARALAIRARRTLSISP